MKATLIAAGIWLISFFLNIPGYLSQQQTVLAGMTVYYWQPSKSAKNGKSPLIIFSHGLAGCGRQSSHIMTALAEQGYWVFAPNHQDARCGLFSSSSSTKKAKSNVSFSDISTWTDQAYIDRRDDIMAVIEALKANPQFANAIDFERLGLIGHSLGGYIALGLAGARKNWQMDGIKAVMAMSPYTVPYNVQATLSGLAVPVMYQGADEDSWMTPSLKGASGSYAQSPAPKVFVEFKGFGHLGWTDLRRYVQADIIAYTLAFLDYYVKGDPVIQSLCQKNPNDCPFVSKISGVVGLAYQTSFAQGHGDPGKSGH
jgi:predicted dienelactone hydrolase